MHLKILPTELLQQYLQKVPDGLQEAFDSLKDAEISTPDFSFYTSVASVFSSKIEGEEIDLDSYIKHKRDGISFQPDYTRKIDDLYEAYSFAQTNSLNESNIKEVHKLLANNLLSKTWQGRFRSQNMYVTTEDGRIEYVATLPDQVETEMEKFLSDLEVLISQEMSIEEVFYYAAFIHLVFVKIHLWNDGNGRCGRLIEKWFLAEKLGEKAWFIPSERMYYEHHAFYYRNIRLLGLEYEALDYRRAMDFILMLPKAVLKDSFNVS